MSFTVGSVVTGVMGGSIGGFCGGAVADALERVPLVPLGRRDYGGGVLGGVIGGAIGCLLGSVAEEQVQATYRCYTSSSGCIQCIDQHPEP